MTTEESMQDEHLALAFECNRQLRAENEALRKDAERLARRDAERERYWDALQSILVFGDRQAVSIATEALSNAMQPIPCPTAEQSKP